jgi:hypothetical protein
MYGTVRIRKYHPPLPQKKYFPSVILEKNIKREMRNRGKNKWKITKEERY